MTHEPDRIVEGMTPLVEAIDIYRFQGEGADKLAILRGVTFAIAPREFTCIMGPSGSGKSTLLHLLSGLDQPSAGRIVLRGRDLSKMDEHQRTLERRVALGYVFQFFNLLPNLTVLQNVGLPLAIAGAHPERDEARLVGLLEKLGLSKRRDAFPHQLSGGEMQRVSIARALAGGQPLLLADEPTGNLSQKAGLEVMQILRKLVDEDGRSVLLVTHNPRDATFADRVLFLVDGELSRKTELRGPDIHVDRVHEALAALAI